MTHSINSIHRYLSTVWYRRFPQTIFYFSCRDPNALTQREHNGARVERVSSTTPQFATLCRIPAWQDCAGFIARVTLPRSPAGWSTKFGIDFAVDSRVRALYWHWMHHSIAKHDLGCVSAATSKSQNYNSTLLSRAIVCRYSHPGYIMLENNSSFIYVKILDGLTVDRHRRHFKKLITRLPRPMQTCNLAARAHAIKVCRTTGS